MKMKMSALGGIIIHMLVIRSEAFMRWLVPILYGLAMGMWTYCCLLVQLAL